MRTLSEAMVALLKSRKMIGADKPSYSLSIGGLSADSVDFTKWTDEIDIGVFRAGNVCGTIENKAIVCSINSSNNVVIAKADSIDGLLSGTESFGTPETIRTGGNAVQSSLSLIDGVLWLLVEYTVSGVIHLEIWKDTTGTGDDFEFYKIASNDITGGEATIADPTGEVYLPISPLVKLSNGNLVCHACMTGIYNWSGVGIIYSTDDGVNWILGPKTIRSSGVTTVAGTPLELASGGVFVSRMTSSTQDWIVCTSADLTSFVVVDDAWGTGWAVIPSSHAFFQIAGESYMVHRAPGKVFKYISEDALTFDTAKLGANWEEVASFALDLPADNIHTRSVACGDYVIASTYNNSGTKMVVCGVKADPVNIPVKSISISRNKNMAASLELLIDNKNGTYSPDREGAYKEVLWPNTIITLQQGYGAELVNTFKGLIDRISMTSFPQEIVVSCRDYMKYLLDQIVTKAVEGGNTHILQYTSQTVEYIVTDLVTEAGLTLAETVYTTGITVDDITFSWCSWADAIQELADLVGADFGCDETGAFYFRKDHIPDTPTIAYIFKEGEDIISLGYTIDDADIYQKVVCYGTKTDGTSCFAQTNYTSRVYYNVLPNKFMKIDAGSAAQTAEAAQLLTNRAEILMRSRVRICQFAAVAVPQLQIGDVIQVIETSSTISEAYRVTDLSTTMDDTYTMMITCYHHSYTA